VAPKQLTWTSGKAAALTNARQKGDAPSEVPAPYFITAGERPFDVVVGIRGHQYDAPKPAAHHSGENCARDSARDCRARCSSVYNLLGGAFFQADILVKQSFLGLANVTGCRGRPSCKKPDGFFLSRATVRINNSPRIRYASDERDDFRKSSGRQPRDAKRGASAALEPTMQWRSGRGDLYDSQYGHWFVHATRAISVGGLYSSARFVVLSPQLWEWVG